jgi:hypothetical protein
MESRINSLKEVLTFQQFFFFAIFAAMLYVMPMFYNC